MHNSISNKKFCYGVIRHDGEIINQESSTCSAAVFARTNWFNAYIKVQYPFSVRDSFPLLLILLAVVQFLPLTHDWDAFDKEAYLSFADANTQQSFTGFHHTSDILELHCLVIITVFSSLSLFCFIQTSDSQRIHSLPVNLLR